MPTPGPSPSPPPSPSPSHEELQKWKEGLLDHLARQVECYRKMVALLPAQHEAGEKQDLEELHRLLAERDACLADVARLQSWLQEAAACWPAYRPLLADEEREAIGARATEAENLAQEVLAADRSIMEKMEHLKEEARQALETFREGTQSSTGYYTARKPRARFIDTRK